MDQEIFLEEKGPRQTGGRVMKCGAGWGGKLLVSRYRKKIKKAKPKQKNPPHSLDTLQNESWGWDRCTPLEGWFLAAFLKPCGGWAGEAQATLHSLCPREHAC